MPSDDPYDPVPDLIAYFAASLNSQTMEAARRKSLIKEALGITGTMDRAEVRGILREAIRMARTSSEEESGDDG